MCIFCGGQCGGVGEFLISLGLPFLALYFSRIKKLLARIKDKIVRRDSGAEKIPDAPITCTCCGEPRRDCREIASQSTDLKNLELLNLISPDKAATEISTEISDLKSQPKLDQQMEPEGVKGWLLLLCLNLTIFIPAAYLYSANCILDLFYSTKNHILLLMFKSLLLYNMVSVVTMLFLAIFSFHAGLRLWNIKRGAVRTVKIFLIIQLSLTFIIVFLRPFMTLSLEGHGNIFGNIIKSLITSVLNFSLWYLYLSKSRRVHKTFSEINERRLTVRQSPAKLKGYSEVT
jgi:hypothetical protein